MKFFASFDKLDCEESYLNSDFENGLSDAYVNNIVEPHNYVP